MTSIATNADDRTWPALVILAYVAMVAMNAVANALPLFGRNTGEVSGQFPSLFTPAPYTFSVWGLIYLALAGFAGFQVLARNRRATNPTARHLTSLRPLFVLSCLLNIGWLVAWHALQIVLSEVLMLGLLVTLIALYRRSGAWRAPATSGERWLVWAPLSLYLGWITVATVANTAITLLDLGFDGGSAAVAITVVVIAVAAVLGLLGVVRRRDGIYALVIAWGLGGVAAARAGEVSVLVVAALVCVAVLVAAGLWALVTGSKTTRTQPT